jgi:hypothetical protein
VVKLQSCRSSSNRTNDRQNRGSEASALRLVISGTLEKISRIPSRECFPPLVPILDIATATGDKVVSLAQFTNGFLAGRAQSRYISEQEQSCPTIRQPFAPHSDLPPHIVDSSSINSCLCRSQGPKNFTASTSEGEESFDRDCSSR